MRSEKSRDEGDDRDDDGEFKDGHFNFFQVNISFLMSTGKQFANEGRNVNEGGEADRDAKFFDFALSPPKGTAGFSSLDLTMRALASPHVSGSGLG